MRANALRIVAVLLLALAVSGCGARQASSGARPETPVEGVAQKEAGAADAVMAMPTAAPAAEAPADESGSSLPTEEHQAAQERMIVRTADVVARFEDVPAAVTLVRALAQSAGGYVVTESRWDDGENTNATMTIRVPAERFDEVLEQVNGLTDKVLSSTISGQDVTEEYFDTESRLRALRATEEQLLLLLEDVRERMKTAEDILAVYRELQSVQSQIEQLEGRQTYLEQMVAMSTINLTMYPREAEVPVVAEGWQPMRTVREALNTLSGAMQGLVNLAIWLVLFVAPIAIVIALPFVVIVLIIRAIVRRRAKRQAGHPPAVPPASPTPPAPMA